MLILKKKKKKTADDKKRMNITQKEKRRNLILRFLMTHEAKPVKCIFVKRKTSKTGVL